MRFPALRSPTPLLRRLPSARSALIAALSVLPPLACGSEGDLRDSSDAGLGGAETNEGTGGASSGGATTTGGASSGGSGGPTWPTGPLRPTRIRLPDPPLPPASCAVDGAGTLGSTEILLGQTHLVPPTWPFLTISAHRPLTVAVAASGAGAAPAFRVTARLDSEEFELCLIGPASLPSSLNDLETSTYRGTLPAAWVQPGLELEVSFGATIETLRPTIAPENGLTVYVLDAELFGEGENEEVSAAQNEEFLARLPVSYLDLGRNPFGIWRPTKLLVEPRSDGHTPNGATASYAAMIVDENPHCTSEDQSAGSCTPHSGYGTMSAVLLTLDVFREANGMNRTSTWYADLAVPLGGGLAGGQRGTGDDFDLTMNHELGHAWGFPHWDSQHTDYPYEGTERNRGGFGDRWALDQRTGLLLPPTCNAVERQSPMQRSGSCVPEGSWFDPFSDYESARLLRMNLGASTPVSGSVDYAGGALDAATRAFTLPAEDGRLSMQWNADGAGMKLHSYEEATNSYAPFESNAWNRVEASEVEVTMFQGAVIVDGEFFFEEPLEYVGNVLRSLDPATEAGFAELYELRSTQFYWARDLHFRFTLDDGTVLHRIYGGEAVLRASGDHTRFAVNLPRTLGMRVEKLEVLSRPLGHYAEASRLEETDTAENYFDAAVVLATWERP